MNECLNELMAYLVVDSLLRTALKPLDVTAGAALKTMKGVLGGEGVQTSLQTKWWPLQQGGVVVALAGGVGEERRARSPRTSCVSSGSEGTGIVSVDCGGGETGSASCTEIPGRWGKVKRSS